VREYLAAKEFIRLLPEGSSEDERDAAFHEAFVQKYPRCFSHGDPELLHQLVEVGMFDWRKSQLSELVDTVDKLEQAQEKLEQTIESTLEECQEALPLDQDPPIWVLPGNGSAEHLKFLNGLSAAYSKRSGGIRVVVYPVEGWLKSLPFVLAHEYHHAVYYQAKPDFDQTFLGWVIAEGLADDFANRLFPDTGACWMSPDFSFLPREYLEGELYKRLDRRLEQTDQYWHRNVVLYLYGAFPYSNGPRYGGRAIAYRVVQGYISLHQVSPSSLLGLDLKTILRESDYHPT